MASDWIKMRCDLLSHPKVVRILSELSSDKFAIIGGLFAVWSVFDAHSEDGILHGYSCELMDHIIGWPGFSEAVKRVGWLVEDGDLLTMPEFKEHNGTSAKRRAEDTKRKRNSRTENVSAICPQPVRKTPDKKRTREEKSINTPISPSLADVIAFVKSKGLNENFARHYHETNTLGGWRNSKGKPITVWKGNCNQWIENLDEAKRARYSLHVVNGQVSIEEAQRLAR